MLSPDDISKFDIEDNDELPPEQMRSAKRKSVLVVITLVLFLSGFLIAPTPMTTGQYDVTIQYGDQTFEFDIILNQSINQPSDPLSINQNGYTLSYFSQYPLEAGSKVQFTVSSDVSLETYDIDEMQGAISKDDVTYTFIGEVGENRVVYSIKQLSDTRIAMGLLFAISFLWLSELIPLAATSLMIPVVLAIMSIQTATEALAPFAQPIIFLFLAGFLMAEAMQRTNLDKFISYRLFAVVPPNGKLLLFSLMVLTAVFSMFMSNTAAVAILIPLALQLLKGVDVGDSKYRKATVLGIAYAATVGGIGSQIGTPPNILAVELLKAFDERYEISFIEWFMFGLPVVIIMLPIIFFYIWWRFKPVVSSDKLKEAQIQTKIIIEEELKINKEQAAVMVIFAFTFGLWLTSTFHGISTGIVALLAAVLLFFIGQLHESDLNVINWNALLTFGGGLSLGGLIIQTGLADYIGSKALFIAGFPIIFILFVISLVGLVLTAFASNTASAVIMIPIVMPLGFVLGISPVVLAVLVAIAASVDFAIVIGTPPTMMAYSTGLFKVKEIFNIGIVLDIIGLFVITIVSWLLFSQFADIIIL